MKLGISISLVLALTGSAVATPVERRLARDRRQAASSNDQSAESPTESASGRVGGTASPSLASSVTASTDRPDTTVSPESSIGPSEASSISVSAPDISSLSSAAQSEISAAASATSIAASASASDTVSPDPSAAASASASASGSAEEGTSSISRVATSNGCGSDAGDAPYTLSCGDLESVITFPNGFNNRPGGIVFLVHGTGSTGEETWGPGPYNTILPNKGPGYDIAWFTSPTRSLGDAQVTAEYIAYNIKRLAQMSATGKVFIIGHSQGNINIQWALAFWPSTRGYVTGFSSLAGDFHGTAEGPLLCVGQTLLQGGCEPSVVQQSVGSRYLAAQNAQGGSALVPTTSIFTTTDEIIQPQIINPTSDLPAAEVIRLQDLDICLPTYTTDHFGMTVAAPAFYLTLSALENNGIADRSAFTINQCTYLTADSTVPNPFETVPGVIKQAALDAIAVVAYEPKVTAEPRLMPYVCDAGAADDYCAE